MKLISWNFHNILIPMMEDNNGDLYCTSKVLCRALGISEAGLRTIAKRRSDELSGIRVSESDAKRFLMENRSVFGIERIRNDMRLWSEDDMLAIALLSKSTVSKEFRRHVISIIKEQARRGYVTEEKYNQDLAHVEGRLSRIEEAFNEATSNAGSLLSKKRWTN